MMKEEDLMQSIKFYGLVMPMTSDGKASDNALYPVDKEFFSIGL